MLLQDYPHLHILGYINIYPVAYNKISNTVILKSKVMTTKEFLSIVLRAQEELMFDLNISGISIHKYGDFISFNSLCISISKLEKIKTKLLTLTN